MRTPAPRPKMFSILSSFWNVFIFKIVCWRPLEGRVLVPPLTQNPGSAPADSHVPGIPNRVSVAAQKGLMSSKSYKLLLKHLFWVVFIEHNGERN